MFNDSNYSDGRRRETSYEKLGPPIGDQREIMEAATAKNLANLAGESVRRRLRREQIISAVVIVVIMALLAGYVILHILGH